LEIDNGGTAAIQGSSVVFYGFIEGIFVAVTAYRPFVQPCASNGFKNPNRLKAAQLKLYQLKAA
jgi:hypothetical protein